MYDTRTQLSKLGFQQQQMTEYKEQTEDDQEKKPVQKRMRKKARKDVLDVLTHCFKRNGNDIIVPLGGPFGYLKTLMRKAVEAVKFNKYSAPSVELISFEPEEVNLGKAENLTLTYVLEPRSRGNARELVAYETAKNRECDILMKVSKTCPLSLPEIKALLTAMKDYDGFGPSRRGKIESIEIREVK